MVVVGVRPDPCGIEGRGDAGLGVDAETQIEAPFRGMPQGIRVVEMGRAETAGAGAVRIRGWVVSIEVNVAVLVETVRQTVAVDVQEADALRGIRAAAANLNPRMRLTTGRPQTDESVGAGARALRVGEVLGTADPAPGLLRRKAGVAVPRVGRRHRDVVERVAVELGRSAFAGHRDRRQKALVEIALAVGEDVAPHQVAASQNVDPVEPMARVGLESLAARREAIRPSAGVKSERDVVERAGTLDSGVVDVRRVDLGPRLAVAAAASLVSEV